MHSSIYPFIHPSIHQSIHLSIRTTLFQRYQPLVFSNKLLINESLYQDLFDVFHTTDWKEKVLVCPLPGMICRKITL